MTESRQKDNLDLIKRLVHSTDTPSTYYRSPVTVADIIEVLTNEYSKLHQSTRRGGYELTFDNIIHSLEYAQISVRFSVNPESKRQLAIKVCELITELNVKIEPIIKNDEYYGFTLYKEPLTGGNQEKH